MLLQIISSPFSRQLVASYQDVFTERNTESDGNAEFQERQKCVLFA